MKIAPIEFTMKDGRTAVLCSPKPEDAEEMIRYMALSTAETDFLMRYPEEAQEYTVESEREFLESRNDSDTDAMITCYVDGRIAGNCALMIDRHIKTRHRASVAIALLKEYWNLGIGTRMLQELVHISEQRGDILQLELDFIEGNVRARALYEKMGFRITGIKPDAIRLKDWTLLNEYMMVRKIAK